MANAIPWGWIAAIIGGGVAVAGATYAATGGGSQPAAAASKPAGSGTVANPGPTTTPSQTAGVGPAANAALVIASQNALALLTTSGRVPGLTYTVGPTGGNGNATDPLFVAGLQTFQVWENAKGGYTPPGGNAVKLNTNGILDYATIAAVLSEAAGVPAPNPTPTPTPAPPTPAPNPNPAGGGGFVCIGTLITAGTMSGITLPASSCTGSGCLSIYYCPSAGATLVSVQPSAGDTTTVQLQATNGVVGQAAAAGAPQSSAPGQVIISVMASSKPGTANIIVNWTDSSGAAQTTTIPVTVTP